MIGIVVAGGTGATALGFSLEASAETGDGEARFSWVSDVSPAFWLAWVVALGLLLRADLHHRAGKGRQEP